MTCALNRSPAAETLTKLYADHENRQSSVPAGHKPPVPDTRTPLERFTDAKDLYMPIDRPFGQLLYTLIRNGRPQTVVEFGTSFGISTIYLAAALRDNGGGTVVTTEFIPEKAETAKRNLADAGLADRVEFRVGDALETLKAPLPGPVGLLFLDGEKSMYPGVLQLLEPRMAPGCVIAADNTDQPGTASFLDYIRNGKNGYLSTPVLTPGGGKAQSGHEISLRL